MALTQKKLKDLQEAKLAGLFDQYTNLWFGKAEHAYQFTCSYIDPNKLGGVLVRPDDVVPVLQPSLEIVDELRLHLATKKLREKYWYVWFAELIIDRFWDKLGGGKCK